MQCWKGFLIILALSAILFPGTALAQGVDPLPPTCCNEEDPPPDAEGSAATTALPQVTISDATLSAMGLTRSEFLDQLSAALFPGQTVDVLIPIISLSESDGSGGVVDASSGGYVIASLLQISIDEIPDEFVNTLELILITDGKVIVVVSFIGETAANPV